MNGRLGEIVSCNCKSLSASLLIYHLVLKSKSFTIYLKRALTKTSYGPDTIMLYNDYLHETKPELLYLLVEY